MLLLSNLRFQGKADENSKNLTSSKKSTGSSVRNSSKTNQKVPVSKNAKNNGLPKKNPPIANVESESIMQIKGKPYLLKGRQSFNGPIPKLGELQTALEEEKKKRAIAERHVEEDAIINKGLRQ